MFSWLQVANLLAFAGEFVLYKSFVFITQRAGQMLMQARLPACLQELL